MEQMKLMEQFTFDKRKYVNLSSQSLKSRWKKGANYQHISSLILSQ